MTSTPSPRLDLPFADGLRAIAALVVAAHHAYLFTGYRGESESLPAAVRLLSFGDYGVPVFIVLSGFVLALPLVRTRQLELKDGTLGYLRRRARRILPPYFASLAFMIVLISVVPVMQEESGTAWDSKVPITLGGLVSHLLLVHNLRDGWIFQINGPAWSVATEWQLYFALPLLLLPVWRRFGTAAMVGVALVLGWAVHAVEPGLDSAHFWFLGLFAFGAAAARLTVSGMRLPGLGAAVAVSVPATLVGLVWVTGEGVLEKWQAETVFGAVVALSLLWLGRRSVAGSKTFAHRVLESRLLVWIGLWSYSLYLIHSPLLGLGNLLLLPADLSTPVHFAVMVVVVLPLALTVAYGFHLVVERRFMTSHQRQLPKSPTDDVPAQPRAT